MSGLGISVESFTTFGDPKSGPDTLAPPAAYFTLNIMAHIVSYLGRRQKRERRGGEQRVIQTYCDLAIALIALVRSRSYVGKIGGYGRLLQECFR